jgi:hypothetical protein
MKRRFFVVGQGGKTIAVVEYWCRVESTAKKRAEALATLRVEERRQKKKERLVTPTHTHSSRQ